MKNLLFIVMFITYICKVSAINGIEMLVRKSIAIHTQSAIPTNQDENFDSLSNEEIFQIDDSLLYLAHPKASIKPTHKISSDRTFSHMLQIDYTPKDSDYPYYLLITTGSLFSSLNKEIKTYAEDVHTIFGYGILIETVENANPAQLKSLIISHQNNLCGVLFIGNLATSMFEIANDHNKYGYKNWPCDLYFMDLDGVWTDGDNNGIYDQHTGDMEPEIFMGRLSAQGLTCLGEEASLIRVQLNKSHYYWWKASYLASDTALNYIDKDWKSVMPSSLTTPVFSSGNVVDIRNEQNSPFSPSDYLNRITQPYYGFTHIAAHSSPILHHFTNGYVHNYDIEGRVSNNYAYNLFCCSACNWLAGDSHGYMGGNYLFNYGKTLTVIGSTKIGGMKERSVFYNQFPSKTIGGAFLYWWQNSNIATDISWSYGMVLLGDPMIDFRYNLYDICVNNLTLSTYPSNDFSNLVMFKAGETIHVSGNFVIPQGVHVIFDAPQIFFDTGFECPVGASFETRNEGCEL